MQKNKLIKFMLALGLFVSVIILNSCMGMMGMFGMGGHNMSSEHSGNNMQNSGSSDTTLIRKGVIDVDELDFDIDGYVYQDQMHWNVISDKPADCPLCGMKLEKVKIKDAIRNLKENDFEVK